MSARRSKPTAPDKLRPAKLGEIIADGTYTTHIVAVPTSDGPASWRIHARELSWEEQSQISDKHTRVIQSGRGGQDERRIVDTTAIMREVLDKMIDGPKCDPPMKQEDVRKIRGPLLQILAKHFGLGADAREENEKDAGESVAP